MQDDLTDAVKALVAQGMTICASLVPIHLYPLLKGEAALRR